MKVLAYIPARSGSKGVPDKNIKPIQGIPLLAFSAYTALDCQKKGLFTEVLVSTDSPEYLKTVEPLGIRTDYLRPAEYADDKSPTVDGILHALDWYAEQGITFDAVMTLQPTAPFRTQAHIEKAIQLMEENPEATCVSGIVRMGDAHPVRIKKLMDDKWLQDFCDHAHEPEPSRRQDFTPPAYLRNGTIYLTRLETLKQGLIRGEKIIGMEMPEANSANVDDHIEFLIAEAALSYPAYREDLSYFDSFLQQHKGGMA